MFQTVWIISTDWAIFILEHGDSKKARERLRRQQLEKTHYQSVFRSGLMLGIGLPAAIAALVECKFHLIYVPSAIDSI